MGEYAEYRGSRVKIGTCESMYYLRADQAHEVRALSGNVDPVKDREELLFRFPFPDEDGIAPGHFEDAFRGVTLHGVRVPEGVEHGTVQLTSRNGYLLNMPCPEGMPRPEGSFPRWDLGNGITLGLNGYGGSLELVMQRYWEGRLVGVCRCKGCGALYRMPERADVLPVLEALRAVADREEQTADMNGTEGNREIAGRYRKIALRLLAGYEIKAAA